MSFGHLVSLGVLIVSALVLQPKGIKVNRYEEVALGITCFRSKVIDVDIDVDLDLDAIETPALSYEGWIQEHIVERIPGSK